VIDALLEAFGGDAAGFWAALAVLLDWDNLVAFACDLIGR
jgi:hypothetical protein